MARKSKADALLTRNSLLDAAERLFHARGVSRTSLQDIATEAGTTRGAIYWHFQDKGDLFNAMMDRVKLPMEDTLREVLGDESGHASTLQRLCEHILDALYKIEHDEQARRVFDIATRKIEYVDELSAVIQRRHQAISDVVAWTRAAVEQEARVRNSRLPMPAQLAALALHLQIEGLLAHWLGDPAAFDLGATAAALIENHFRGLGLPLELKRRQSSSAPVAGEGSKALA